MKNLLLTGICLFLLCGCTTLSETESPEVKKKFSPEAQLRLENFQLVTLQTPKHNVGWSLTPSYNFTSSSFSLGGGPYVGGSFRHQPDALFAAEVKDLFESANANIRTQTPQFTLEGRIGEAHFRWGSGAMWYRDAPTFLFTLCTLGSIISYERENDIKMLVYNRKGKKLKEYNSTAQYHAVGLSFLLACLANDKMSISYGDRMATKFALINCLNAFILDYNRGVFR